LDNSSPQAGVRQKGGGIESGLFKFHHRKGPFPVAVSSSCATEVMSNHIAIPFTKRVDDEQRIIDGEQNTECRALLSQLSIPVNLFGCILCA
jgi:hypothetical protein